MDINKLMKKTKELQEYNQQALQTHMEVSENPDYSPDFFAEVKPFADKVKESADEWKPLAEQWIVEEKPDYFYIKQIDDTHENLLISSVLAFQSDTKKKRFREMIQSIEYIMSGIQNDIRKKY